MIGNNACGSRALGYGRTADNVTAMRVAFGTGEVVTTGAAGPGPVETALAGLTDQHLGHVRTEFGRFTRQVSGYSLEHLLPENGRRLDRFLVGSEGTLGLVLDATVRLVTDEPERRLVVLGYPSMAEAADAVPALLGHPLVACEGLDARIVDLVRASGSAVPDLPRGAGWLFVEVAGAGSDSVAARVVADAGALEHRVVADPGEAAALWRIREDGAGLAARSLTRPAYSGWEDAAVPPEHLGAWLRDFDGLLVEHGLDGVPYGHFGDGCVHVRIDFPFDPAADDAGRGVFRDFLTAGAPQAPRVRRLAVGRARRRPGPVGAAAADVRRRVDRGSSPRSRRSATPTTCSTPACSSTRRRSTPTCGRSARGCRSGRPCGSPTTAARWATRCTAAPASASAWRPRPAV